MDVWPLLEYAECAETQEVKEKTTVIYMKQVTKSHLKSQELKATLYIIGIYETQLFQPQLPKHFDEYDDDNNIKSISIKMDSVQSSSNYLQKLFTKNLLTAR